MKLRMYETPDILVIPMSYHEDVCQNPSQVTNNAPTYEVDDYDPEWDDE